MSCTLIDTLVWRELNTSGHLLTPRAGHSTIAFGKKLFVFGGFTDAQNLYNDLYMLDIGMYQKLLNFSCLFEFSFHIEFWLHVSIPGILFVP